MAYVLKLISSPRTEGAPGELGTYTYEITRSTGDAADTVKWAVAASDPAKSNNRGADALDFKGSVFPTGEVSFGAGELSKSFTFYTVGDKVDEFGAQIFNVGILNSTAVIEGTIYDDDDAPDAPSDDSPVLAVNGTVLTWVMVGDRDNYKMQLEAGTTYTLASRKAEGTAFNYGHFDVLDAWGSTIVYHATGGNSATFTPSTSGLYFVAMTSDYNHGGYELTLTSGAAQASMSSIVLSSGATAGVLQGSADLTATGNEASNTLQGNQGNNVLRGGGGNDLLAGGAGNDVLDGGTGIDTASFNGAKSAYTITRTATGYSVTSDFEGVDTLAGVERLKFSDKTVALDIDGNAGQTYRLYQAAFDRVPDSAGLKFWISQMDAGANATSIAAGFIASKEFTDLYGANPTNEQFIGKMYDNILHRAPDAGGYAFWLDVLNKGAVSHELALASFAESAENQAAVIGVIQNGIELPY